MSSIGVNTFTTAQDVDRDVEACGSFEKIARRSRGPQYRRSGTAPGSVNGIHRRRQSRWSWGHGRAARLENLRAFARCVVAAVLAVAVNASMAATIGPMVTVGDPGNAGKVIGSGTFGSVAETFDIGKYEVSNAQYVEFLNATAKDDTLGLFNTSMDTNTRGGIVRAGSPGAYTYSVKTTGTANYGEMPANFVSVYSAARYVNWLHNGAPVSPSDVDAVVNAGSYTLPNTADAGVALVRNPGATYVLPTQNEWFKAAYYNPGSSTYSLYASGVDSPVPAIEANPAATGTNVAYYGQPSASLPMVVDGLESTVSSYGLVGVMGNVSEWLETSTATQATWNGGWFNQNPTNFSNSINSNFAGNLQPAMLMNAQQGFRIAMVPEPSTVAMAMAGLLTVLGTGYARRRQRRAPRTGAEA